MLTESGLQELLAFQSEKPVLSVYLNTEPSEGSADAYRLRLRSMLKNIELQEDVQAVERFFEREFDWSGRSVVVFSCAPEGFFRAFSLAIPVRDRLRIANQPHVKPLADLLDFYGGYGVTLVDQQGARMFYFHLGELREQDGVLGEAIRRTKHGGASAVAGRRGGIAGQTKYTNEAAERNMREAVEVASHFFTENNVRRILLGGTEDNVALFRTMLPKSWQSLVVGAFPMSMSASKDEVLERAMQIGKEAEYRHEDRIAEVVFTNAAKKRGGVVQLEDTLKAVYEGRVQILVLRDGYRAPGFRCKGCEYLTSQLAETCPYCGGEFEKIPDAVEMAVRNTMQQGGEVEVLHRDKAAAKLGNIGAILRY